MKADGTAHTRDSERRERMEQIEGILRRFNPELSDEQLQELTVEFFQRSGFADG